MAVLIPSDIVNSQKTPDGEALVGRALQSSFPDDTWVWYNPPASSHRPRFVMLAPDYGVVGIDVCDWSLSSIREVSRSGVRLSDGRLSNPASELGSRLEALRARLAGLRPEPPLQGLVTLPKFSDGEARARGLDQAFPPDLLVTRDRLCREGFDHSLTACPSRITDEVFNGVRDRLYPDTSFQRPRLVSDDGRTERIELRIRLDAQQEQLARTLNSSATIVRGVAGSGKSLVLAARARCLAELHPDWRIQTLCFNRALVPYLETLVGENRPNVNIATFHKWMYRDMGIRLPWGRNDEELAREEQQICTIMDKGLYRGNCDAILVDEGQDFRPIWYRFLSHALRPNRGGLLVVVDGAQSIYREPDLLDVLDKSATVVCLGRNYRNTVQIGRCALGTVFGVGIDGRFVDSRQPPSGRFLSVGALVQLVWAENWDEQAQFIVAEIARLVSQTSFEYRDIAVLFPKRAGTVRRITENLAGRCIPFYLQQQAWLAKSPLDLRENSVKVLTIHAAKGLEFPVVFVFGAETVKIPADMHTATEKEANMARVLYVGMSRATDLLYLTYTKSNRIIERAQSLKACCEFRRYPDDFE